MSNKFLISGYWKLGKESFEDYLVIDSHDTSDEDDDDVFYYGLSEKLIQEAILSEDNTIYEFVITSYRPFLEFDNNLVKYVTGKYPETIGEKLIYERNFNKLLTKEIALKNAKIEDLSVEISLLEKINQDMVAAMTVDENDPRVSAKQKRRMSLLRSQNETIINLKNVVFRLREQIKNHGIKNVKI